MVSTRGIKYKFAVNEKVNRVPVNIIDCKKNHLFIDILQWKCCGRISEET